MTGLSLRAMTAEEMADYRTQLETGYIRQQVDLGGYSEADAAERARTSLAELWPDGGPAEGHHLMVGEVDGTAVGRLWLAQEAKPPAVPGQAWIFDIEVDEAARGRGHGRGLMQAALDMARELGCTSLGLNVFGGNDVAIKLYQSLGFRTRAMQMSRTLS